MYPGMGIKEPTIQDVLKQIKELTDQIIIYKRDQVYRQDVAGMKRAWQERGEDNVDATHPLTFDVYFPTDTKLINRAYLRIRLKKFRAYSKGALGGGGDVYTSEHGIGWVLVPADPLLPDYMELEGSHDHGGYTGSGGDPLHTHEIYSDGSHAHGMVSVRHVHELTLPDHTHPIDYGIYEGTAASNVTVTINGVDRTAALGGPFNTNQDRLDITQYLTATGWNTIEIGSATLGRIHATLFVEPYIP